MNIPKTITKKLRFEVFKRDSFTCQYCGAKSPDVVLHVDHIHPKSKGGKNNILNLITSCEECNSGKSNRILSDDTVIKKQQEQLETLQQKREQIEMMYKWQSELLSIDEDAVNKLAEYWSICIPGYFLTDVGLKKLRDLYRKFGMAEIMSAMKVAINKYLEVKDDTVVRESANVAFNKIGGICYLTQKSKEDPNYTRLYYIRGILRNRVYVNKDESIRLMKEAIKVGVPVEDIEDSAKQCRNWTEWRETMYDLIKEYE